MALAAARELGRSVARRGRGDPLLSAPVLVEEFRRGCLWAARPARVAPAPALGTWLGGHARAEEGIGVALCVPDVGGLVAFEFVLNCVVVGVQS